MLTTRRPLVVRLRNWVGDATLGIPALCRLTQEGYDLQLVGKGWARDLLAGHGWPVHVLPGRFADRVSLLRRLRRGALEVDPAFDERLNALVLPYSFSSALEFRLAGFRGLGHAHEGRSLLLSRTLPRPRGLHELAVYWQIAQALLGRDEPLPARIGLLTTAPQRQAAVALVQEHAIAPGFVVICPFAGGTWDKADKTWPAFAEFVRDVLPAFGRSIVICPGPGAEEEVARECFPGATCLAGVRLGTYAALLADASLMISNDTGPGHLAAAVGTPLVSVLGPSEPALWRAWGPSVTLLGGGGRWPGAGEVKEAVSRALAAAPRDEQAPAQQARTGAPPTAARTSVLR